MRDEIKLCPICGLEKIDHYNVNGLSKIECRCERCGTFIIEYRTFSTFIETDKWNKIKHILSGIINENLIRGLEPIEIIYSNVETILSSYPYPKTPKQQGDRLLYLISRKIETISEGISLDPKFDYPLCYGKNEYDLQYFLSYLKNRGLIKKVSNSVESWTITVEGWEYLENIYQGINSKQVFVAMWFDDSMDDVYLKAIKPALDELGYEPIMMKFLQHNEKIDDRIIAEIRKSIFIISDVSEHRQGVYFEAGFAMGFGIPVIWTCNKNELEHAHFDTRQFNHIIWNTKEDLKQKLIDRIEATIPFSISK